MELTVLIILLIILGAFVWFFGRPFWRGAPYAVTATSAIDRIVRLAGVKAGDRSIDIGSGDGRLVIALAKTGVDATGIEINPFLIWLSRQKARASNVSTGTHLIRGNFWHHDLSPYSLVTIFGIPYIMKGLEEKLRKELKPGARVIVNRFPFPSWEPDLVEQHIYRYTIPGGSKKILTLCIVHRDGTVLLGMKKRGFGMGRWNGFGGKVHSDETIEHAAHRELNEETGITATDLRRRGILTFTFEGDPDELEVHLFSATSFTGEPMETDEMRPQWFDMTAIPYSDMWPDDIHWLPLTLEGKNVLGRFHFKDTNTLISHEVTIVT